MHSVFLTGILVLAICLISCVSHGVAAESEATAIRIAQLTIKPEHLDQFIEVVKEEMQEALKQEPGVIALYAVSDNSNPNQITFFEMYVDDGAYEIHRTTPHFIKYFETTKDMIAERVLSQATPVELRDKHNTPQK